MARRKKAPMKRRSCRTFTVRGKKRKICKMANGKVKFKPMSFKFS